MEEPVDERTELLDALIENAFRFLNRAIGGVAKDQQLAIADFTVAMEILLKAVLFHEHWALIAERPHEVTWDSMKAGTAPTLSASKLLTAIPNLTGVQVPPALSKLLVHRNRVLHFTPRGDIEAVAAEMWRVWHEMHRLMNRQWEATFIKHMRATAAVEMRFAQFTQYLQVRFDRLDQEWKRQADITDCTMCGFKSAKRGTESSRLVSVDCAVCHESANLFLCDKCGKWVPRHSGDTLCSQCFDEISLEGIAEELKQLSQPPVKSKVLAALEAPPTCPMCQAEASKWRHRWLCVPCNEEYFVTHNCSTCGHHWAGRKQADEVQCEACASSGWVDRS